MDSNDSDAVWLTATDYLTPTTLALAEIGQAPETLKTMPAFFDAKGKVIEQHFATSKDGTRVPYFVVHDRAMKLDGSNPTLLYGYGGFEISLTPSYSGGMGRAWLEKGGVYVVANIRGGGEYGPRWHQAALKQNRHKAYEDMAAVARDLVKRKITSAKHLGVQGGSNGGLLTGNMLTQYPELFGAVVVQVPLLDMKRYSHLLAGASWMAEYGNPDTSDWEFIKTFSPYHLFNAKKNYPPVLFTTSTRDDRVHPGHARKMAAKMIDAGKDVTYYENIEGVTAAPPTTRRPRTCRHWPTASCGSGWAVSKQIGRTENAAPGRRFPLSAAPGHARRACSAARCRRAWPGATENASIRAQSAPPLPAIAVPPGYRPGARAGWRDGSRNPGPG